MGPIISTSTIPDPWGGIGGVGVPPSRGSPLVFGGASSTSPPSAGKTNPDPWTAPAPVQTNNDPWGAPAPVVTETPAKVDPFSPPGSSDPHDVMAAFGGGAGPANPWDMGGLDPLPLLGQNNGQNTGAKPRSAVENLLGEHSALVNLDSLVDNKKTAGPPAKNPFAEQPNPFQAAAAPKPSMNQLRGGNQPSAQAGGGWPTSQTTNTDINPFF